MSALMLVSWLAATSQVSSQSPAGVKRPSGVGLDGPSVYKAYCASCHGADGKGRGPAAEALNRKPIDLTVIAKKNKGMFPRATIEDLLANGGKWKAHGSKEMPTWGPIFQAVDGNENLAYGHIHNLVTYLESIQAK